MDYPEIRTLPKNPELEGFAALQTNIPYCERDGREYTLDLIRPWAADQKKEVRYPLVVFVQGSGWTTPGRGFEIPQLSELARKGYVVATVGHRSYLDGYKAPAFLKDVKTAIRFLRANAEKYNIDPERVGIWGTSSGGNTALLVGTTAGDPRFLTEEYADQPDDVKLVVDCFGPTDLIAMTEENYPTMITNPTSTFALLCGFPYNAETKASMAMISPLNYVTPGKDFPAFLLLHGTSDPVVAYSQSTRMFEKLIDCGYEAEMAKIPGAPHEGSFWSRELLAYVFEWIESRL